MRVVVVVVLVVVLEWQVYETRGKERGYGCCCGNKRWLMLVYKGTSDAGNADLWIWFVTREGLREREIRLG